MATSKEFYLMFAKAAFFFVVGVILASLFVWCLMQGVLMHLVLNTTNAFIYYCAAWLAGVAALALYLEAKAIFHYAQISR